MQLTQLPALLLAAGGSSRLGQPKQLVTVSGEPLLRRTIRIAGEAGFQPVHVVLGAYAAECRRALDGFPVPEGTLLQVIQNESWREGMSSSLRLGLAALSGAEAVLLLVCDQPRLTRESLERLGALYASSGALAAAARYGGRLGVPAIVGRSLFAELERVQGDRGARGVLEALGDRVAALDLPEAAVDVDTPQDLSAMESGTGSGREPAPETGIWPGI